MRYRSGGIKGTPIPSMVIVLFLVVGAFGVYGYYYDPDAWAFFESAGYWLFWLSVILTVLIVGIQHYGLPYVSRRNERGSRQSGPDE
jgi:hypothetical protein